jgi:putative transposase
MTKQNNTEVFKNMLVQFLEEKDPIQAMMEYMANTLMELEVTSTINAEKGTHSPERKTHRNGYRTRRWDTRVGTIRLLVPKVRSGGFQPFFLVNRQQSELALVSVVQECFINGVSTRKMKRVLSSFGVETISPGQVSRMTKELENQVNEYRVSPLENEYSVVWIDALYEKIRDGGRVVNKAVMIAMSVNSLGQKVILAIEPMENESNDTWLTFFDKLKKRGLSRIGLLVSDGHPGIQSALKKAFIGSTWQRCKVHFMRNVLARVSHSHKKEVGHFLSLIFTQDSYNEAKRIANDVIDRFESQFPEAMDVLSDGLEDAVQFFHFPVIPKSRTSSTNHLERLNREIRRRSNVVGTFPSTSSFLRLIGSYLLEYQEEWQTANSFIDPDRLISFWSNFKEVSMAA